MKFTNLNENFNASECFGNRLKTLRNEKGLSQKQVSDGLGVAVSTYANWEQGRREPNIYDIYNIIFVLEIQPNELFEDWNDKNPFLWGISWTSVMEIGIRCSNWCYSYCFLAETKAPEPLLNKLRIGILNMTDYIVKHYSRYSSANNHLIVEAYAVGQTGILFDYKPWIDFAVHILTREQGACP